MQMRTPKRPTPQTNLPIYLSLAWQAKAAGKTPHPLLHRLQVLEPEE
jgi:hypothetical protein